MTRFKYKSIDVNDFFYRGPHTPILEFSIDISSLLSCHSNILADLDSIIPAAQLLLGFSLSLEIDILSEYKND